MTSYSSVILDFNSLMLAADLFNSRIAENFAANLPYKVNLEKWGRELYGSIGIDLGEEKPVPDIPPGGIAYTRKGNYVCIFFGQRPAWDVEYIGQIHNDEWKKLMGEASLDSVTIRLRTP